MKKLVYAWFLILSMVLVSCSSVIDLSSTQRLYREGDFSRAYQSLMAKQDMILSQQGALILNLDGGMLSHMDGNWKVSNSMLSVSEREIQDKYTQSITANIGSFIVNDNTKEYPGEDYEDIYINVFKALNYTQLGEDEDALVELRRSIEKQAFLKSKYEVQGQKVSSYAEEQGVDAVGNGTYSTSFSSSALANYLAMVIARGSNDANTFSYSLKQVTSSFQTQPELYPFPLPSSLIAESEPVEKGKVRLNLVAFNGLAPEKREFVESIYVSPYNYAKIAYPVLIARRSEVKAIKVTLDEVTPFRLEKIESIEAIAIETFKAKASITRMKAITRSLIKSIGIAAYDSATAEAARKANTEKSLASELLGLIFKIARDISETADVRSSHFLPATAWAGGITVSPGTYTVKVEFQNNLGRTLYSQVIPNYVVSNSKTNLIEAVCPF
jgi:hypothetical protein